LTINRSRELNGELSRRALVMAALACATGAAAAPVNGVRRSLVFEVWRNRQKIGGHTVDFRGTSGDFVAVIEARMTVSLGPFPVFRYLHQATETWRDGRFASLESHTYSNGKREQVSAIAGPAGVAITTLAGKTVVAPAVALPLTHWNPKAFDGPMFNPQTGALIHEAVSRQSGQSARLADGQSVSATRVTLAGEAQIIDWYDLQGAWTALRGRVSDGSFLDYLRAA
jgi:hypothetical protein